MTNPSRHTEWLSLVEVSGPFLAVPVLEKAFPQGLDIVETPRRQHLRAAYDEWCDAVEEEDPLLPDLHREWLRLVFTEILEYDSATLNTEAETAASYTVTSPERTESFKADWLIVSPSGGKPRLFVSIQPPGTDLEKVRKDDRWPASLLERMTALCRAHSVRLGLITDGERWMLVNAPSGAMSSDASWYARLWFQEPVTLKAFQSLWSVRRCFGPADETLEALLERSLEHHEEITDTLGEQVRRAVEVLVQCLDKADADRNRELLRDVSPAELYEAGLTVMMRLVFVLCAEERGLLLSGDPVYDECYAISTLRAQLAEEADRHGPEVLDRRHDAWSRLLSVFRAVHGGIDHESLRMPALGGSLFDPDKFPFLEGRPKGTRWRESGATPLPIDNRTVLLLLGSLQLLEQHGGALLLSYRALDVEQIGHVYEGLLEHTVARVPSVTVGLAGAKNAKNPNLPLSELESARMDGEDTLAVLSMETSKRSESAIRNALTRPVEEADFGRLLSVCGGDTVLAERIRPFANLLRTDAWDDPIVYRENAFMVTLGADRRETGTHYTPKSLTESIVGTTLEPVTYAGPTEGKPREEWRLKSSAELLDLKICDPAMGSGAFLVQACRWLAERLVEAWVAEEAAGKFVTYDGDIKEDAGEADPMPTALDERLLTARRLIAERCLYGVDVNPLAVELAKLSIWLVTLAKGRPFGFLGHNLRHGDSLLGIHRLDQLTKLRMNPDDGPHQQRIFGQNVATAVAEAIEIRKKLRVIPIRDIRDVEAMARLDKEARGKLKAVELVADAMIGEVLRSNGNSRAVKLTLDSLAMRAGDFLSGNEKMGATIRRDACEALSIDSNMNMPGRKPFHWPLEFPEVFLKIAGGFNVMVGNPPYINAVEQYSGADAKFLKVFFSKNYSTAKGSYDVYVLFAERVMALTAPVASFGLLVPNKILSAEYAYELRKYLINNSSFYSVLDFSRSGAFTASVYPIAVIIHKPKSAITCSIRSSDSKLLRMVKQSIFLNSPGFLWGHVLTEYSDLLMQILPHTVSLGAIAEVCGAATVSEAYDIAEHVKSRVDGTVEDGHCRFVVSGNIRPFCTTWDTSYVQYLKQRYEKPIVNLAGLPPKRKIQALSPKIVISGLSRRPTAFYDDKGEYLSGKSTVIVLNANKGELLNSVTAVLNSKIAALIYRALFGGLELSGGYLRFGPPQIGAFPVPASLLDCKLESVSEVDICNSYGVDPQWVSDLFSKHFGETNAETGIEVDEE
jgi:hypothetical protein